ncbi:MAG: polyphenol oxidase family protein, partial [Actinomycetota bacterium]|nr:polyphenol oxidase family protein [Actinomycetota bacterium]
GVRETKAMSFRATLEHASFEGIGLVTDPRARKRGWVVAFTNRHGGVSPSPFDSLNLGGRVGDDDDLVRTNRERATRAVALDPSRLVLARQVHGNGVLEIDASARGSVGEGDGLLARDPGPVLSILTADCAPVVVAGRSGIAVLHAGWRGLVGGVLGNGLTALGDAESAWIGPCIRACCYEVGPEVVDAFRANDLPVADESHVDPALAAESALRRAGLEEVAVAADCTHCSPDYFSYRRDGVTGRQGALAALVT